MKRKRNIIIFLIVILGIGLSIYSILNNNFLYIGNWELTPEKALEQEALASPEILDSEDSPSRKSLLTVKKILDVIYFEHSADIIYISEAETFSVATVVRSRNNTWHYYGMDYEENIDDPISLIASPHDNEQETAFDYNINYDQNTAYGFKHSDNTVPFIDDNQAQLKNYQFIIREKSYSIDYWWISNFQPHESQMVTYSKPDNSY